MNVNTKKMLLASALVFLVVLFRVIEHPFNATPMIAVMLFSAAVFSKWSWKIIVPLAAILISDSLIHIKNGYGFHNSTLMVYGTFALIFAIGYYLVREIKFTNVLIATLIGSLAFFLVTNFALFYPPSVVPNPALGHYPHNLTGIIASYEAGLPFFRNMIVGDLIFSAALFGSYSIISKAAWFSSKKLA